MAVVQLDLVPDPDGAPFKQLVELDSVSVYLQFRWVDRSACWVLSVADESGADIVSSISLINNWDLLAPHRHDPRIPQGTLMAWAQTDSDVDAGKAELGGRVQVVYIEAE